MVSGASGSGSGPVVYFEYRCAHNMFVISEKVACVISFILIDFAL